MPLSFESISHGTVAFGFFNIHTDLLLLENRFFFATDFCEGVVRLSTDSGDENFSWDIEARCISDPSRVGNLMGAIHGWSHTGFIGEVYRKYPFPTDPAEFKQRAEAEANRPVIEKILAGYAEPRRESILADRERQDFCLGEYRFTIDSFQELLKYVWRGGYPKWKDDSRPACVRAMHRAVGQSRHWLLNGIVF